MLIVISYVDDKGVSKLRLKPIPNPTVVLVAGAVFVFFAVDGTVLSSLFFSLTTTFLQDSSSSSSCLRSISSRSHFVVQNP